MTEGEARDEICRVGRSLFERGYVHGTAGNISVRLDESQGGGYLITPTDACLGFLDAARLARLDADGRQLGGEPASKTMALHAQIYAASRRFDRDTACIIHTHSTHCVALTLSPPTPATELLPPITPYFVMKVGHVPLIPYHRPGSPDVGRDGRRSHRSLRRRRDADPRGDARATRSQCLARLARDGDGACSRSSRRPLA